MKPQLICMAASLAVAGPAAAQQQDLLFSTLSSELTRSAAPPLSLQEIEPQDVLVVTPRPALHTAEKFAPHDAWLTLIGDDDNDGLYWEAVLSRRIDAVFVLRFPTATGADMREVHISPMIKIDGAVSGTALRPGDVARVIPTGQFRFFLLEEQIRSAFGIPATSSVNVDAVTADPNSNRVYLSLEDDTPVQIAIPGGVVINTVVGDGAILAIPVTNVYAEPVFGVVPNTGIIVATEAEVDAMVDNSNVRGRNGLHPLAIDDLDGLTLDPLGGHFSTQSGRHRNLLFCGETVTGGGILSTGWNAGWGRIAVINGVAMAETAAPTVGAAIGLRTLPLRPDSLNGLHLTLPVCHFVTETPQPTLTGGSGTLMVDIGGADPAGATFVLVGFAPPLPPAAAVPLTPYVNPCFPEHIPFIANFFVPIDGQGYGSWQLPGLNYGNITAALVCQAVTLSPATGVRLSTPLTIQLLP